MHLTLEPHEKDILAWSLRSSVSDLGLEIADTENQELRDDLKVRKATLMRILASLEQPDGR